MTFLLGFLIGVVVTALFLILLYNDLREEAKCAVCDRCLNDPRWASTRYYGATGPRRGTGVGGTGVG